MLIFTEQGNTRRIPIFMVNGIYVVGSGRFHVVAYCSGQFFKIWRCSFVFSPLASMSCELSWVLYVIKSLSYEHPELVLKTCINLNCFSVCTQCFK